LDQLRTQLPDEPGVTKDAFKAPAEWFPAPEAPKPEKLADDKAKHELKSIYRISAGGSSVMAAVIDRHSLKVGESFDTTAPDGSVTKVTLTSADDRTGLVVIDVNGDAIELKLDTRAKAAKP
jgi:hypothetical protein